MRAFLAALALAGALIPFPPARADVRVRVAQMARDVTDAVRKQRQERARIPAPCGAVTRGRQR